MDDVSDLGDEEVAEAEAGDTDGAERMVDLHGVLQHGDADGGVERRAAEAAAEADAEGLGADGAHGAALARLPAVRVALGLARRHGCCRGGGCCWVGDGGCLAVWWESRVLEGDPFSFEIQKLTSNIAPNLCQTLAPTHPHTL